MPKSSSDAKGSEPAPSTPGRPKESGSRQQTYPDQKLQSGSPALDKESTRKSKNS
jgi:hypothetical protein